MPRGQIIPRKSGFTVRVFTGRDTNGKRNYKNQRVTGTKKDAQEVLTSMLRKLDTGDLLLEPTAMTLAEYLEYWLETSAKSRVSEKTFYMYSDMMRRYVCTKLGKIKLTKLEPNQIQGLYTEMQVGGLSARTVRYTHMVLKHALKQSVKWRMASRNPADYVDLPGHQTKEAKVMDEHQVEQFLDHAKSNRMYVYFALLLGTGMRPGEGLGLRWQDFDAIYRNLTISQAVTMVKNTPKIVKPKTKKSRRSLVLPDHLVSLLLSYKPAEAKETDLIFASQAGTPLSIKNINRRYFKPLLQDLNFGDITDNKFKPWYRLYDLRHTHATMLLKAGVHPKIVSERLGHSSITLTLDTYSHVLPSMQDEAAKKINQLMFNKLSEGEQSIAMN